MRRPYKKKMYFTIQLSATNCSLTTIFKYSREKYPVEKAIYKE